MAKKEKFRVITEPLRLAFPHLATPAPKFQGSERLTYQAVGLIPPDFDLEPLVAVVTDAMIAEFGERVALEKDNRPIKRCDDKDPRPAGYDDGWFYINAHSGYPVALVDARAQPVTDPEMFYPGCWCSFAVEAWAWTYAHKKGVSWSLTALQFVRGDDRLDNVQSGADLFTPLSDADLGDAGSAGPDLADLIG